MGITIKPKRKDYTKKYHSVADWVRTELLLIDLLRNLSFILRNLAVGFTLVVWDMWLLHLDCFGEFWVREWYIGWRSRWRWDSCSNFDHSYSSCWLLYCWRGWSVLLRRWSGYFCGCPSSRWASLPYRWTSILRSCSLNPWTFVPQGTPYNSASLWWYSCYSTWSYPSPPPSWPLSSAVPSAPPRFPAWSEWTNLYLE